MKTFTVRELDREPSAVLASSKIASLPDFAGRRKALFLKPISAAQARLLDKLIAGE